jgi:hypothetical protein
VVETIHFPGGQIEVNIANVDQVVSVVLRPHADSHKQPVVLYLPFGVYDPYAQNPNLNANIVNALYRFIQENNYIKGFFILKRI